MDKIVEDRHTDLKNDTFFIPYKKRYIVYSPLRKASFYASSGSVILFKKILGNKDISEEEKKTKTFNIFKQLQQLPVVSFTTPNYLRNSFNYATILLTDKCNFECSYCYSQEARSKSIIKKEDLKTAIDFLLENGKEKKFVRISYLGGGEPTIMWNLLTWAIEYSVKKATKENIKIVNSLTTNGSLLTKSKIDWLKKHNISISLSFDILPEIQNIQRKIISQTNCDFIKEMTKKLLVEKLNKFIN